MTPQASFCDDFDHKSVFEMAADYAFQIAENQPFVDGNKRNAFSSALVFLDWHNIEMNVHNEELYSVMIDLSQKTLDKAVLVALFQKLSTLIFICFRS